MISVVIPVGPYEANKRWLKECLDSVKQQTYEDDVEIIIIDDGSGLGDWMTKGHTAYDIYTPWIDRPLTIFRCPWRTGVSHAFNYGISLASYECVFMLGSDDTLEPQCLEQCAKAYLARDKADGYYSVPVRYINTGEIQTLPCNAGMITKQFFKTIGGFPIQSAIGRGDSMLLSICIKHNLPVFWVGHDVGQDLVPLYNYRSHPDMWTAHAGRYHDELISITNKVTEDWTSEEVAKWAGHY